MGRYFQAQSSSAPLSARFTRRLPPSGGRWVSNANPDEGQSSTPSYYAPHQSAVRLTASPRRGEAYGAMWSSAPLAVPEKRCGLSSSRTAYPSLSRMRGSSFTSSLLLSKSDPLRWALIWVWTGEDGSSLRFSTAAPSAPRFFRRRRRSARMPYSLPAGAVLGADALRAQRFSGGASPSPTFFIPAVLSRLRPSGPCRQCGS